MIVQIEGKLLNVRQDSVVLKVGQLSYEVMVPAYAIGTLSGQVGRQVTLSTVEYYESAPGGGNIIPRLVGFITESEKDFFASYTSVKGMGIKKALKSLSVPISTIASAVEAGDEKILMSLPSIGKRFAQQIIAQLKGKLEKYAYDAGPVSSGAEFDNFQMEALEILIAWGEKRPEAVELINMACKKHPEITAAEQLVPLIYRIKQGVEV